MELQFNKTQCTYLRTVLCQVQNQEQTQEVRLPDDMPDIGRVLGAWGQVLMRGKEWRSGGMGVSGGVMSWVLYAPEDGGEPRWVEAWIPFQTKWDFSDPGRDGMIQASCSLRSLDARSVSARKLMVRANVGIRGEAMVSAETDIYSPGELPADIQLLKKTYPVRLPKEAGEKPFLLEEELILPGSCPRLDKLLRYELRPEMIEQKVVSDKIVFRGNAVLHLLYRAEDGSLQSWNFELPFSQYTELERDYDQDASARVCPAVTSLELDVGETGALHLKAGLTGQYIIYDRTMLEIVEDAYSPNRTVAPRMQQLQLPAVLEERREPVSVEQTVEADGTRVADVVFYPDYPRILRESDGVQAELAGAFQMLYYDPEGNLRSAVSRWENSWALPAAENSDLSVMLLTSGEPRASVAGGNADLRADAFADVLTIAQQGMPMVTGLETGELTEADPNRPSLILRRAGNNSLWELAKSCGSTVEAIRNANQMQEEPAPGQMLLIPVI